MRRYSNRWFDLITETSDSVFPLSTPKETGILSQEIIGTNIAETLTGTAESDELYGRGGNDTLLGLDGNDFLDGEGGNDTLTGGAGDDRFGFQAVGGGFDIITDFELNEEIVVNLSGLSGDLTELFILDDPFSGVVGQIRFEKTGGQTLLQFDVDGDRTLDSQITIANGEFDLINANLGILALIEFQIDTAIRGTNRDDEVSGTAEDDIIRGFNGDDRLQGLAGDDEILSGNGDDVAEGGAGNDMIEGGGGADDLSGGAGDDALRGGDGEDTLRGGDGNDEISGGDGDDIIYGGTGNDDINGGRNNDRLLYSDLTDTITIDFNGYFARSTASSASGTDEITAVEWFALGSGNDVFNVAANIDDGIRVDGGGGNDDLSSTFGDDRLEGGAGDDILRGSVGDDIYDGGEGFDTLDMSGNVAGSLILLETGQVLTESMIVSLTGLEDAASLPNTLGFLNTSIAFDILLENETYSYSTSYLGSAVKSTDPDTGVRTSEYPMPLVPLNIAENGSDLVGNFQARIVDTRYPDGTRDVSIFVEIYSILDISVGRLEFIHNGFFSPGPATGVIGDRTTHDGGVSNNVDESGITNIEHIIGSGNEDALIGRSASDSLDGGGASDYIQGDALRGTYSQTIEGQVFKAYQAVFNRAPDAQGFAQFVTELRLGNLTFDAMIAEFIQSPEFVATYGDLDNEAFMQQLYRNVLQREADAAGLTDFTNALNNGTTRVEVVSEFASSTEFNIRIQTNSAAFATNVILDPSEGRIFRLYQAVFDRTPDEDGFINFVNALWSRNLTFESIASEFIDSPEFIQTYDSLSDAQFVERLYANVLPGNDDPVGRERFTSALQNEDITRADMVIEFVDSQEFRAAQNTAAIEFVRDIYSDYGDTLTGGAGNDTLLGGRGADKFIYDVSEDGQDVISDFTIGLDVIELESVGDLDNFAAVMARAEQIGLNTVFDFRDGQILTVENVNRDDLSAQDFMFAALAAQTDSEAVEYTFTQAEDGYWDLFA